MNGHKTAAVFFGVSATLMLGCLLMQAAMGQWLMVLLYAAITALNVTTAAINWMAGSNAKARPTPTQETPE